MCHLCLETVRDGAEDYDGFAWLLVHGKLDPAGHDRPRFAPAGSVKSHDARPALDTAGFPGESSLGAALRLLLAAAALAGETSDELQTAVKLLSDLEACPGSDSDAGKRAGLICRLHEAVTQLRGALEAPAEQPCA